MLEQLKELLEMQRVLDESIFKEHGITEYPLENMKLALFDELGELLHEFPTEYKHWKKSAVDNREKGLEEYVDCLHFALSITNYFYISDENLPIYNEWHEKWNLFMMLQEIVTDIYEFESFVLGDLFRIGNYFGFTWEEIYSTYKKKNAINYERLRNNY